MGSSSQLEVPQLPRTAILEMTYRCNHDCIFCYCPWSAEKRRYSRGRELGVREWKELIDALALHGVSSFTFSGGEPLLKPGLEEIVRHASSKSVTLGDRKGDGVAGEREVSAEVYLISNGRAISDRWIEYLAELDAVIALSLPGLSTYESHTGYAGAEETLEWMRRASEKGLHVVANVTATRRNLPELCEVIGESLLHGASSLLLNRFLPGGRGLSHVAELWLPRKATIEAFDMAEEVLRASKRSGSVGTEVPRCVLGDRVYTNLEVSTTCSAAVDFFAVDPAGYIRVCNHSEVRVVHWTAIRDLASNVYWQQFAERDYFPLVCSGCADQSRCGAGCREMSHIVGGDVHFPDPVMYT